MLFLLITISIRMSKFLSFHCEDNLKYMIMGSQEDGYFQLPMNTASQFQLHFTTEYCFLASVEDICICIGVGAKYNRFNCQQQMRRDQDGFSENVVFAIGWG